MAEDVPDSSAADAPEGVFGNLPRARPGPRSPRRSSTGAGTGSRAAGTERRPAARAAAPPPPPPPPPPPGAEREAPVAAGGSQGPHVTNVEDLAWAGIAVAAQAATVGVRFASRALEAARKSIERP